MGKVKKSTKKFVKNKLKDVVARRKKTQAANKWRKTADGKPAAPVQHTEENVSDAELSSDSDAGFDDSGLNGLGTGDDSSDASDYSDDDLENLEDFDGSDSEEEGGMDIEDSDNSDDDEEDDLERVEKQIEEHKKQLEELKERDPEFHKYLQENSKQLLDFAESDEEEGEDGDGEADADDLGVEDEEEEEEEEGGEEEGGEEEGSEVRLAAAMLAGLQSDADESMVGGMQDGEMDHEMDESSDAVVVTKEMLSGWKASLVKNHSLRALRKVLLAFRAAAAVGGDEQGHFSYSVEDGDVFNKLLLICIRYAPIVFDFHLYGDPESGKARKGLPSGSSKWKKVQPLVKSYLTNLLRFLKQMTDVSVLSFTLRESEASAVYFACFPKLGKDYLRQLLKFWTSADEQIRVVSFLCIRRLAIAAPTAFLDMCLKGTYLAYANQSRATSIHTWAHISFMASCIVELCGLHMASTYQHAFTYIRQLAVQLRNAITTKTKESFKGVYNWQFVHCIRLWTRVLSTYCEKGSAMEAGGGGALKPLIYPLVQVTIGVMRLKPSSKFFPLRFHCVRSMIELARKTGTFVPVASHLFEIFESNELRGKAKPSTLRPLDFTVNIRAPNPYLGTRAYQIGVAEEAVSLLFDYYGSFALSIAFPELAVPAILQLKRFVKRSKNFQVNKQIQQLVEKLEQNSKFIDDRRSQVEFSPKDEHKTSTFLNDIEPTLSPLYKHNAARQKLREQEIAKLQAAAAEEDKRAESAKGANKTNGAAKSGAKKGKGRAAADGDEDLVEDFVMSDEGEVYEGMDVSEDEEEDESEE
ncbi:Nucleolar Complex 2 protein [Borealophlyctis nickersoniae]|nr:Nucleolar Complex 2 protein [Borealophlyctis nickersoniae]